MHAGDEFGPRVPAVRDDRFVDAAAGRGRVAEHEIDLERFEHVDHEVGAGPAPKSTRRRLYAVGCQFGLRIGRRRARGRRLCGFYGDCGFALPRHRYGGRGPCHGDASQEFAPAHFGAGVLTCHDVPLASYSKRGADDRCGESYPETLIRHIIRAGIPSRSRLAICKEVATMNASLIAVVTVALSAPLGAQWLTQPTPGIPRTPDGKPNLAAPAPRTPDGKPDLSGLWNKISPKYARNIAADLKPEEIQSWVQALVEQRREDFGRPDRSRRRNFGSLELEVTFSDPAAYARPWTVAVRAELAADTEMIEFVCNESGHGLEHWVGKASDERKGEIQVASEILAKYIGTYEEQRPLWRAIPRVVEITLSNGRLFADMDGRGKVPLIASSETAFSGLYGLAVEFNQSGSGGLFLKHVSGNYRFA